MQTTRTGETNDKQVEIREHGDCDFACSFGFLVCVLQFLGVLNPNKQTQPCAVFTRRTKSTTVYKCPQTNETFKILRFLVVVII